jgi:hypothetical protein
MPRTKEEIAEYQRSWRELNRERLAAYRVLNKDRIKAQQVEYNKKNRERILTQKRERRAKTTVERSEYNKKWYQKNKVSSSKRKVAWRRANKEHVAEYTRVYSRERPWMSLLSLAKRRSSERGLPYGLSVDWAISRWTGRCEISGIELIVGSGRQHMRSPTIDRIDAKYGYTPDNCRFVCLALNAMRGDCTDEEMLDLLFATVEFQSAKMEQKDSVAA